MSNFEINTKYDFVELLNLKPTKLNSIGTFVLNEDLYKCLIDMQNTHGTKVKISEEIIHGIYMSEDIRILLNKNTILYAYKRNAIGDENSVVLSYAGTREVYVSNWGFTKRTEHFGFFLKISKDLADMYCREVRNEDPVEKNKQSLEDMFEKNPDHPVELSHRRNIEIDNENNDK